jgi:hypothetical protein
MLRIGIQEPQGQRWGTDLRLMVLDAPNEIRGKAESTSALGQRFLVRVKLPHQILATNQYESARDTLEPLGQVLVVVAALFSKHGTSSG